MLFVKCIFNVGFAKSNIKNAFDKKHERGDSSFLMFQRTIK